MNHTMPGRPELSVLHQGLVYRFPSEKMREVFRKNPEKYAVKKDPAAIAAK
jgi:YHS domain-containing protein